MSHISVLKKGAIAAVAAGALAVTMTACGGSDGSSASSSDFAKVKSSSDTAGITSLFYSSLMPELEKVSTPEAATSALVKFNCAAENSYGVVDSRFEAVTVFAYGATYEVLHERFAPGDGSHPEVESLLAAKNANKAGNTWCSLVNGNY